MFAARSATSVEDRTLVLQRAAEIQPDCPADPRRVLRRERTVEPEPVTLRRYDGGVSAQVGEVIAGCQLREEERRGRNNQDEQYALDGATQHETSEAALHVSSFGRTNRRNYREAVADASVSALHSSCGSWRTGVGPSTRGVVATVTRGATK